MADLDSRKLRELNESFSELTGTVRATSQNLQSSIKGTEESTKKSGKIISRALERAAKAQQRATQQEEKQTEKELTWEQKQEKYFQEEIKYREGKLIGFARLTKDEQDKIIKNKRNIDALDQRISKERELIEAASDPVKSFRDISSRINSISGITGALQEQLFEVTGKSKAYTAGLIAGTAVISGVIKAASSMADSLFNGERGARVGAKALQEFSKELTQAAYAISAAMLLMPGVGIATRFAGAALAAFTFAAEGATKLSVMGGEYTARVYDAFNKFADVGLATGEGMSGISNTIEKLGVTSAELEKFGSMVGSNAKDLALFGGTAAGGLEKFTEVSSKLSHPMSDLNKKFLMLGVTSDQQREHTLKYMAMQTRMGMMKNKNTEDQIKGATAYIEELDRIATITGVSRKEQEDNYKAIMAIEELRAAQYRAANSGDTETARVLEQSAKYAKRLLDDGRKKEGAAFARLAAAGFDATSPETASAMRSSRGAMEAIKRGGVSDEDVYRAGLETAEETLKLIADNKKIGGDVSAFMLDLVPSLDAVKRDKKLVEEFNKSGFDNFEDYTRSIKQAPGKPDPTLAKNVEAIQLQQRAGLIFDEAARMMDGAAITMAQSVDMFNKAVDMFAKARGYQQQKEKPTNIVGAQKADTQALEKQQKAIEDAERVLKDPNATPEQRKLAESNRDMANREAQITLANRREMELKLRKQYQDEMKALRQQGKADQVITLDKYLKKKKDEIQAQTVGGGRGVVNPVLVTPGVSSPSSEPVTPPTGADFQKSDKDTTTVPTPTATPVAPTSQKDTEVEVPAALLGGIFKGPSSSSVMPNSKKFTANDILNSIKSSTGKVERKTVDSELPGLEQVAEYGTNATTPKSKKNDAILVIEKFANIMESKLDDMIEAVSENNNIKEELLLYSRV